jgi:hypothetical protein
MIFTMQRIDSRRSLRAYSAAHGNNATERPGRERPGPTKNLTMAAETTVTMAISMTPTVRVTPTVPVAIAIPVAVPIADKAGVVIRRSHIVGIYGNDGRGYYRDARH